MLRYKIFAALLATLILSNCTPVDTPNAVMFSTQNSKAEANQG